MNPSQVDLERMEAETGIPASKIVKILSQPVSDEEPVSKDFIEAREEYSRAKIGSLKRIKALLRWITFAETAFQLREVFGHTMPGSFEEREVVMKMAKLYLREK